MYQGLNLVGVVGGGEGGRARMASGGGDWIRIGTGARTTVTTLNTCPPSLAMRVTHIHKFKDDKDNNKERKVK